MMNLQIFTMYVNNNKMYAFIFPEACRPILNKISHVIQLTSYVNI
jgi:hypothetical protein